MHTVTLQGQHDPVTVGKIVCVARNYAEHARELGNPLPDRAVLFIKPASSILPDGGTVVDPGLCRRLPSRDRTGRPDRPHRPSTSPPTEALAHVAGYGVALDLTLREVQTELKAKGLPWEIAKAFDTACPLSAFIPAGEIADPQQLRLRLTVNGRPAPGRHHRRHAASGGAADQ